MRSLLALAVYLAWIMIGGGLAAPWVYHGAQALADATSWESMRSLAAHPFHRYVHRSLLVMALAGLPVLARALGVRRWVDVGFPAGTKPVPVWKDWRFGLLLGLGMFLPALGCEVFTGVRVVRWPAPGVAIATKLLEILGGAVLIGLMEETLFRGVLFGGLKRSIGVGWAIVASSLIYAWVHFFERPAPPSAVVWHTGLEAVSQMLGGLVRGDRLVPFFVTLTLAGALLAWWYERRGTLWLSMGVHSGWVVSMKVRGWLTTGGPSGGGESRVGLTWEWLCLVGIVAVWGVSLAWRSTGKSKRQAITGVS